MSQYTTVFGSLASYQKGSIELITGSPKHYVFSNVFEVAAKAKPYEKVVVAKNLEYVIETIRAEGTSPWFACAHDEFAVCIDGTVEVHYLKLEDPTAIVGAGKEGTVKAGESPKGKKMGYIKLKRGHQALLPAGAAYQFRAESPSVILLQTIKGDLSLEKWREICLQ
jgi:hypothetical protein